MGCGGPVDLPPVPDAGASHADAGAPPSDAGAAPPDAGSPPAVLEISVTGNRTEDPVCAAVFEDGKGFPDNEAQALFRNCVPFSALPIRVTGVDAGHQYGVSVFQDANANQNLDKSALGFPTEGFGFSNNPKIGFGAPAWSAVRFDYGPATRSQSIRLVYCSLAAAGCQ